MGAATGRLAQLVEHLVYTERVGGSSPSPPTSLRACARFGWQATTVSRREGRAGRSLLRSLRFGKSAAPNPSGARRSPTSFLRPSHGLRKSSPGTCNPGLTCLTPPFKRTPPSRASALCAGVAQLVRASACHAEGRGFEPRHSRHFPYWRSHRSGPHKAAASVFTANTAVHSSPSPGHRAFRHSASIHPGGRYAAVTDPPHGSLAFFWPPSGPIAPTSRAENPGAGQLP